MNARKRMNKQQQLSPRVLRELRANGKEPEFGGTLAGSPAYNLAKRVRQQRIERRDRIRESNE